MTLREKIEDDIKVVSELPRPNQSLLRALRSMLTLLDACEDARFRFHHAEAHAGPGYVATTANSGETMVREAITKATKQFDGEEV